MSIIGDYAKPKKRRLTGAEILVESLLAEGVDTVFGYPGGQILPVYDALYESKLHHILTRHEQGAIHAADGYSRASGKAGVVIATSGPGATNLVTGLATAYMDSIPVIAITGQVPLDLIGRDSFQEADIYSITMPIVKNSYLVKDVKDLARVIREAFYVATTGRPGPVLIDLPKSVQVATALFSYPPKINILGYRLSEPVKPAQLVPAVQAIMNSKRPLIYAGGGIISSYADKELQEFIKITQAPVTTTLMGKGVFPETHPLSLGMLGMHGTKYANFAVCECDLLIALGVRFDDRVTGKLDEFACQAKIIHIDIDPAEIGKNVHIDIPIEGDVKQCLQEMIVQMQAAKWLSHNEEWAQYITDIKTDNPLQYDPEGEIKPQYVIEQINELTGGNAIVTTDVGQHQMWAAQYYQPNAPRKFITSGGLGTMGFGLPAGIGAQVACPEQTVFVIAGDGGIQMNSQEIATACQYGIPVKVAIINNRYLGMVRQWQELFFGKRYSQCDLDYEPDFVKLAEAYGAVGLRVTKTEDVVATLKQAIATPGPVFIDFRVEREENVYPMVPPGGVLNGMLGR